MKVNADHPLAMSGKEAAIHQLRVKSIKPLNEAHVEFGLDALNGELIVTSLERSEAGAYGLYSGEYRLSYGKLDLETALPYPIVYRGEYPVLFARFRQWLFETYRLVIEDNEFEVQGVASSTLSRNTNMTFEPNLESSILTLRALPTSGRFIAGTTLRLLMAPSNGPINLDRLVFGRRASLRTIAYPD